MRATSSVIPRPSAVCTTISDTLMQEVTGESMTASADGPQEAGGASLKAVAAQAVRTSELAEAESNADVHASWMWDQIRYYGDIRSFLRESAYSSLIHPDVHRALVQMAQTEHDLSAHANAVYESKEGLASHLKSLLTSQPKA